MMKVFPDDLLYSREHVWVRVEGDLATIGITDYAQEKLGEVISLDLPEADAYLERDEPFGKIESVKSVVELICPLSGVVVSVNEDLPDEIAVVNSDPHDTGWMVVMEIEDPAELDDLLDVKGYQEFLILEAEAD
ncbi:MAG: glycine cleavage system protein GcvH [Syntrophales bacterium]|nr:glycine cleavage system protein GcvH [Syntrophales bacterium]